MVEIFRDIDRVKVGLYKSLLEDVGIPCLVRNESLAGVEVSIPVFYPALCVVNEGDVKAALTYLKDYQEKEKTSVNAADMNCLQCNELNPANFEICWSCGSALQAE